MRFAIQVAGGQIRHDKTGIEAVIEQAGLAEAVGFDTVFVPDHYVFESLGKLRPEVPAYEMFFVMATLAQRTKTIRIGSHVACLLFRHPAMHARLFAQVDEASGGRVIAGVGAGWTRAEFAMMGIEFPDVSENRTFEGQGAEGAILPGRFCRSMRARDDSPLPPRPSDQAATRRGGNDLRPADLPHLPPKPLALSGRCGRRSGQSLP